MIKNLLILALAMSVAACQDEPKATKSAQMPAKANTVENAKTKPVPSAFNPAGNYVSGEYQKRDQGYDWMAVQVSQSGPEQINVSIRSRIDRKRPTCTYTGTAQRLSDTRYKAETQGTAILFDFTEQGIEISTEQPEAEGMLNFFCSGGASIKGGYSKLSEPLDNSQLDQSIFNKTLVLQGIGFNVTSFKGEGENRLTIAPFGLSISNEAVSHRINGRVVSAEIEDLNSDGSPELLVFTQSDGSGSYGEVIGYSVNNKKSMSQIYFQPVTEQPMISAGYMGHDEFAIVETSLVQRFPVYGENDTNAGPTKKMRQVQYKLVDGEAMRRFVIDKVVELDLPQ
ncbi:PliI family lysozyme inhibitor of I-type lysozyme [Pseudoalteromonas sp. BDTF-M6]|uniref:PliI family lysozyme inhibitor of I-type lysozyme n=1 Tax=Pseudoalteromonas sp. BDTF-M6 TaxID=2796132 RepID=UPI001BAE8CC2|nr:PliI family lysozyme inhibitor of I-type lysozyme [Pseudoalteromonas sp. BDTF-M6]MBS3797834.1 PliI family lysozyme inhibitor of I-type lysozyme [Pseudoalteromonas sp. BDTF-M6]